MTRFYSVPFRFTATALTTTNQASLPIQNIKRIAEVFAIFPSGSQNLIYYRLYLDATGAISQGTWPGGRNIFEDVVPNGELSGDSIGYSIPIQKDITERPIYFKMGAQNDLAADLTATAIVIIEGD